MMVFVGHQAKNSLQNKRPTWCHLLFYFTSYVFNMFRTLIYPSSGACDYSVELQHWSYCTSCVSACNTDTTPTQPHRNSNKHRTKNKSTDVLIQQNSRKLLMMDILMPETCWNKISSENKLVFYSWTITMMHGPINISFAKNSCYKQNSKASSAGLYTQLWKSYKNSRTH